MGFACFVMRPETMPRTPRDDAEAVAVALEVPDADTEPLEIPNQVADAHSLQFSDQDANTHGIADVF